jgi:ABC-type antimicrobial peptide transport system permease subunit
VVLLLARGVKREREIALRAAVGAGRMRLVRQMVTESLVLSVAGLAGGMVVSWLLLAAMQTFLVDALARGTDVQMNWTVLVVALAFSAVTSVVPSLRNAMREIDPTMPFKTPETMTEVVSGTLVFERMESWLFGIFAAFALLLAVVGLYGLVNHEVELRRREIGIRMALGSTRGLVLRRVALLMVAGAGAGWVLTLALKKVLASVVEMHASHDAALLAGVTAGLIAVGVLVSVAPARRAATIDPMQALRNE